MLARYILNDIRKKFLLHQIHDNWALNTCLWQFGKCPHSTDNAWDSSTNLAKRNFYLDGKHLKHFSNETIISIALSSDQHVEEKFGYKIFMDKRVAEASYNKFSRCSVHWPESYLWSQRNLCNLFVVVRRLGLWNIKKIFIQIKQNFTILLNFGKQIHKAAQTRLLRFFFGFKTWKHKSVLR